MNIKPFERLRENLRDHRRGLAQQAEIEKARTEARIVAAMDFETWLDRAIEEARKGDV